MFNMFEPLQPTFILYYLVVPVIIGAGIDIRTKNRFAFGAACGVILYVFVALWYFIGPGSTNAHIEGVIILATSGLGLLVVGFFYEYKRDVSVIQRHALAFSTVSSSGLPLYMVKSIIDGTFGIEYPASLLPLFQFTLALVALVMIANIFEARMYSKNEARKRTHTVSEKEQLFKDHKKMELDRNISHLDRLGDGLQKPQLGYMEMGYDPNKGENEDDLPYSR